MRFVFFYDRIVNINHIVWMMKHRNGPEPVYYPTYIMKLIDGTTLQDVPKEKSQEERLDRLIKNLQSPDVEYIHNLHVNEYKPRE